MRNVIMLTIRKSIYLRLSGKGGFILLFKKRPAKTNFTCSDIIYYDKSKVRPHCHGR